MPGHPGGCDKSELMPSQVGDCPWASMCSAQHGALGLWVERSPSGWGQEGLGGRKASRLGELDPAAAITQPHSLLSGRLCKEIQKGQGLPGIVLPTSQNFLQPGRHSVLCCLVLLNMVHVTG